MKLSEIADLSDYCQDATNFVICVVFLLIYLVSFYHARQKALEFKKVNKVLLTLSIVYIIIYTLKYGLKIITDLNKIDKSLFYHGSLEYIDDSFLVFGHFVFYLFMITILKEGFKHSFDPLKISILILLYTLLMITFIINEIYFIVRQNYKKHNWSNNIHPSLFLIFVLLNIILGIILLYEFNKRIYVIIQLQLIPHNIKQIKHKKSRKESIQAVANSFNTSITEFNLMKLMRVSIKYTLLCSLCIIVTNISFCGWIIVQYLSISETEIIWFSIIWSWLYDVVLFIHFFCIWLSFPFANHIYYKNYICGNLHHKCCQPCCSFIVSFRIGNVIYNKETNLQTIEEK